MADYNQTDLYSMATYKELIGDLKTNRRRIRGIMYSNRVFSWPSEDEFETWLDGNTRIPDESKAELVQLANSVTTILKAIATKLDKR